MFTCFGPVSETNKLADWQAKNGMLPSPAVALANNVFPVPGGPCNKAPYKEDANSNPFNDFLYLLTFKSLAPKFK